MRVTVPDAVVCTLCQCELSDEEEIASEVMGRQQDDEDFLFVMCDECARTHVISEGGDA